MTSLVLASASPRRVALLAQIGLVPDLLCPQALDETPMKGELPKALSHRLAREKVEKASQSPLVTQMQEKPYILGADTVVALGRRILDKPPSLEVARAQLTLLSGRAHRVYTTIALRLPSGACLSRTVETRVCFKRLSDRERESYLATGEWQDKAGGYALQGYAGAFVRFLSGSSSAVIGLPLYETKALLEGVGFFWSPSRVISEEKGGWHA